jgi:hypothetical protein
VVLRIANDYLAEHRADFLMAPENGFDLEGAQRLLTGFKQSELFDLLYRYEVPIPDITDPAHVPDSLIMEVLGVERATAVPQVNGTAVEPGYTGELKDPDKPLVQNAHGQTVAYQTTGMRKWAEFYGPRQPDNKGRVWISHSDFNANAQQFDVLGEDGSRRVAVFGHDHSRGISTYQFSFYNEYTPDGPSADPEAVQQYRSKFLQLLCEIAQIMGGVQAVNITYGISLVIVPEQMEQLGYADITWLKGEPGVRQGWDNEHVSGVKETEAGREILFLRSCNSMVPWNATRRIPIPSGVITPEQIDELLTF